MDTPVNLADHITLYRPLCVIDVETTGPIDGDRIIQIAITQHKPEGDPISWSSLINPGIRITPESMEVHHITDEMVKEAHPFKFWAQSLADRVLRDCDYAGYNIHFDLKHIRYEMRRAGVNWNWETTDAVLVDAMRIYKLKEPRTLSAAHIRYVKDFLVNSHDAGADVAGTERVLAGQLQEYGDLPRTVDGLADFCWPQDSHFVDQSGKIHWRHGEACFGFGKHRGRKLQDIRKENPDYFTWIVEQDFPEDTKQIVRDAMQGVYPKRK